MAIQLVQAEGRLWVNSDSWPTNHNSYKSDKIMPLLQSFLVKQFKKIYNLFQVFKLLHCQFITKKTLVQAIYELNPGKGNEKQASLAARVN